MISYYKSSNVCLSVCLFVPYLLRGPLTDLRQTWWVYVGGPRNCPWGVLFRKGQQVDGSKGHFFGHYIIYDAKSTWRMIADDTRLSSLRPHHRLLLARRVYFLVVVNSSIYINFMPIYDTKLRLYNTIDSSVRPLEIWFITFSSHAF